MMLNLKNSVVDQWRFHPLFSSTGKKMRRSEPLAILRGKYLFSFGFSLCMGKRIFTRPGKRSGQNLDEKTGFMRSQTIHAPEFPDKVTVVNIDKPFTMRIIAGMVTTGLCHHTYMAFSKSDRRSLRRRLRHVPGFDRWQIVIHDENGLSRKSLLSLLNTLGDFVKDKYFDIVRFQ